MRATVTGVMKKPPLALIERGGRVPLRAARRGERSCWFAESSRAVSTPVFDRAWLRAGNRIAGPALIEEHASTTVLLPGDRLLVDPWGNLDIEIGDC